MMRFTPDLPRARESSVNMASQGLLQAGAQSQGLLQARAQSQGLLQAASRGSECMLQQPELRPTCFDDHD